MPHTGTYSPKPGEVERRWHVIDADDVILGRLASHAARLLRGKHKPQFAPHVDTGDFVIVVNASKIAVSGAKRDEFRYRHSGYPGGLSKQTVGDLLDELEDMRMVERFPDPDHGVIKRVRLGPKGKVWAAEVKRVSAATEAKWATRLGTKKMRSLRARFEVLSRSVEDRAGRANGARQHKR